MAALRDPRVVCRRNPVNLGPEANWNRSLEGARGTYIKLFHQDDLLDPECLALQVAALERQLRALSPVAVLERGYSLTRSADGKLVRSVRQVAVGARLRTQVADGTFESVAGESGNSGFRMRESAQVVPSSES